MELDSGELSQVRVRPRGLLWDRVHGRASEPNTSLRASPLRLSSRLGRFPRQTRPHRHVSHILQIRQARRCPCAASLPTRSRSRACRLASLVRGPLQGRAEQLRCRLVRRLCFLALSSRASPAGLFDQVSSAILVRFFASIQISQVNLRFNLIREFYF